jgi:DNA (cytosine-5)-methyltransferase 1
MYSIGELFAGIGGIGLGFKKANGFKLIWANEIDANACATYKKNFRRVVAVINKDMTTINPSKEIEKVDILTGGFPCQAFSIAGYRKGFKDERGNLFFDILRFIKAIKPRVIFLENVKNLSTHDNGKTFEIIQDELKKTKYHIKFQLLNTSDYSEIPQNRERIYIVCFRNKQECDKFQFPRKSKKRKSISDLLEPIVANEFYYNDTKYYSNLKEKIKNTNTIYQWRRTYVRENKSKLCPTLTANMGMGGHNVPLIKDKKGVRKLTPRECARFQGFPDEFILPNDMSKHALYKQIGNSVSVPVVTAIAKNIKKALEN